jgi:hypothetical protein
MFSRRIRAIVLPISALLAGAGSTKPVLKSGLIAAMKLAVSPRLNNPCMPVPAATGIRDLRRAAQRLAAAGIKGSEIHLRPA